jgi:hypothetical protein
MALRRLMVSLDVQIAKRLERAATAEKRSISAQIAIYIQRCLKQDGSK